MKIIKKREEEEREREGNLGRGSERVAAAAVAIAIAAGWRGPFSFPFRGRLGVFFVRPTRPECNE
jgi:hypothetical protein